MTTKKQISLFSILFSMYSGLATSHARLNPMQKPFPRSDSSGLKVAPCGGVAATVDPTKRTVLQRGQQLEVKFQETINHPGHYRIAFSPAGDTGFDDNILLDNILDIQEGAVSVDNPRDYKVTVTVPDMVCDKCAIQLIQVMTDRNPPANYYSCADISIVDEIGPVPAKPANIKVELK